MTERPPPPRPDPTEAELEAGLRDLGPRLAYPPTPDVSRAVRRHLNHAPAPRPPWWRRPWPATRRLAVALATLVLLLGAALALSPDVRRTVADRLGVPGIGIVYEAPTPTATSAVTPPPPVAIPTAPPVASATRATTGGAAPTATAHGPLGDAFRFGASVTLEEAGRRASFPVLAPALPDLGAPDAVYFDTFPPGGQVALVYGARPGLPPAVGSGLGLYITQFRGAVAGEFFMKGLGPGTRLEEVTVNGGRGYWISGEPHSFFYRDASGQVRDERSRAVGNTLLWEREGVTYRLEANISRDEALRIAASLR